MLKSARQALADVKETANTHQYGVHILNIKRIFRGCPPFSQSSRTTVRYGKHSTSPIKISIPYPLVSFDLLNMVASYICEFGHSEIGKKARIFHISEDVCNRPASRRASGDMEL